MKKSIILIISVTLGIVALILLGSVLQIGDKLGRIGAPLEYGFYILILALLVVFVAVPVIRVHCAPQMPALTTDGVVDAEKLSQLGTMLERNCSYIPDDEARKAHRAVLRQSLKGAEALSGKESRRSIRLAAMRDAHRSIPSVIMNSAGVIGKSAASRLVKFFTFQSGGEEEAFAD